MARVPTSWSSNPDKNQSVPTYSDSSVTYSSATTSYSSPTVALDELDRTPSNWTLVPKNPASWQTNPNASANQYIYDSASILYDTTRTYDGVVSGQDIGDQTTPTAWSEL